MVCKYSLFILKNGETQIVELLINTPDIEVNSEDKYTRTSLSYAAQASYILLHTYVYYV